MWVLLLMVQLQRVALATSQPSLMSRMQIMVTVSISFLISFSASEHFLAAHCPQAASM